jgi:hypothetical protein
VLSAGRSPRDQLGPPLVFELSQFRLYVRSPEFCRQSVQLGPRSLEARLPGGIGARQLLKRLACLAHFAPPSGFGTVATIADTAASTAARGREV